MLCVKSLLYHSLPPPTTKLLTIMIKSINQKMNRSIYKYFHRSVEEQQLVSIQSVHYESTTTTPSSTTSSTTTTATTVYTITSATTTATIFSSSVDQREAGCDANFILTFVILRISPFLLFFFFDQNMKNQIL